MGLREEDLREMEVLLIGFEKGFHMHEHLLWELTIISSGVTLQETRYSIFLFFVL
jgi:hypothetical protein